MESEKTPDATELAHKLAKIAESLFDEMILHQQEKVLKAARVHHPHLTHDDILNPHDFPSLMRDPIFNYEEGFAAGLLSAQIALRARLNELKSG